MKKALITLIPILAFGAAGYGQDGGTLMPNTTVEVNNDISTKQDQDVTVTATGSNAQGGSSTSNSQVNINTTTDYETRTPPLTTFPPYLPYWTHGGWGTIKAYFSNGPTVYDAIYETTFDPRNREDMRELRSVLRALPHRGLVEAFGGALNDVAVAVFGTPDMYHHGRGFEIADSIVRDRRPAGKPLLVFIDSNVNAALLREEGYAYMGKVSIEGEVDRNWDHVYKAAVAEALPWDVDVLLVSGGMKGVTVGSNVTFPSAAGGYSQMNYSLSLFGAFAKGITEGKGKAVLSAEAYRFGPDSIERRRIPESLYERIRLRPGPVSWETGVTPPADRPAPPTEVGRVATPPPADEVAPAEPPAPQPAAPTTQEVPSTAQVAPEEAPQEEPPAPVTALQAPVQGRRLAPRANGHGPGIEISRELFNMTGFDDPRQIEFLVVR